MIITLCVLMLLKLGSDTIKEVASQHPLYNTSPDVGLTPTMLQNMNLFMDPCMDFSDFACGGWFLNNPAPRDMEILSIMNNMSKYVMKNLENILATYNSSNAETAQTKTAQFYRSCRSMMAQTKHGVQPPMLVYVNKITRAATGLSFRSLLIRRKLPHNTGKGEGKNNFKRLLESTLASGLTSRFFKIGIDRFYHNNQYLKVDQGDFFLPPALSILKNNALMEIAKEKYKKVMKTIISALYPDIVDLSIVDQVIQLEIELLQNYDPESPMLDLRTKYNKKMNMAQLEKNCPEVDWLSLVNRQLQNTGITFNKMDEIVVVSERYLKSTCNIIRRYQKKKSTRKVLLVSLIWGIVDALASTLERTVPGLYQLLQSIMLRSRWQKPNDRYRYHRRHRSRSSAKSIMSDYWLDCMDLTAKVMPEPLGNIYVTHFFQSSHTTNEVNKVFRTMLQTLINEINNTRWIETIIKSQIIRKMFEIKLKIGYDADIMNQRKLDDHFATISIDEKDFMHNYIEVKRYFHTKKLRIMFGGLLTFDQNFIPYDVNAFFVPYTREIFLPAALLQPPLFDPESPRSHKFGSIGMIIGHELVHALESVVKNIFEMLRFHDENTIPKIMATKEQFRRKMNCIVDQYINYKINGRQLPGELTWPEDISDNVGLQLAYAAHLQESDLSTDRQFFIQFAQSWCSNMNREESLASLSQDDHSFWKYRINGPVSNMPEFSAAFSCSADSSMNRKRKCLFRNLSPNVSFQDNWDFEDFEDFDD